MQNFHRKCATTRFELGDRHHVLGEVVGFQSCRHDDEAKIGSLVFLKIQATTQGYIDGEPAFMKLIEDHGGNTIQRRVVLKHALEYAIGEIEDFGIGAVAGIESNRVTGFFSEWSIAVLCNEPSEQSCSHAAGLDDDHTSGDFRKVSDDAGNFGGFS